MKTDSRPFWDDALNVILSQTPPAGQPYPASGTRASATDVPGVSLEWMVTPAYPNGAWFGSVGFHASQASLDAVPTLYLATGSTAMVAGIEKQWNGSYWIAPAALGGGIIYDGVTYPLPITAPYKGYKIAVVNPAVPDGWSTLKSTGTTVAGWVPPAGELIAAASSSTSGPLALVTPGVTTLTQIWASEVIPDYMIPELLEFEIDANLGVKNPSPVAGYMVGVGISGAIPTGASQYSYPASFFGTPGPTYFAGIGSAWTGKRAQAILHFGAFKHPDAYVAGGGTTRDANTCGNFVSGSNRVYAMAKPSSVSDQVRFDCVQVYSKGNL